MGCVTEAENKAGQLGCCSQPHSCVSTSHGLLDSRPVAALGCACALAPASPPCRRAVHHMHGLLLLHQFHPTICKCKTHFPVLEMCGAWMGRLDVLLLQVDLCMHLMLSGPYLLAYSTC